jgi:hypothetical protein
MMTRPRSSAQSVDRSNPASNEMGPYRQLSRIYGVISPAIHQLVSHDIDGLIDQLILEGLAQWRAANWHRFDDLEINCTVQLYRWIREAGRYTPALRILTVQLEWVQPTPTMIDGSESAAGMRRPDLRISCGQASARSIECKRLALADSLPKRYVDEGIYRFVSAFYGADEDRGAMIGYVQANEPADVIVAVNSAVEAHGDMGATHRLHFHDSPSSILHRYGSNHSRNHRSELRLRHYLVDIRSEAKGRP